MGTIFLTNLINADEKSPIQTVALLIGLEGTKSLVDLG
jgi:hypothetical protein